MAHNLDQIAEGIHSFVSARENAWHRLGTVLESTFTAEEAMTHAHLGGWNVRKLPLTATQMDIKCDGLSYEILEKALAQAKAGREHILGEMMKTISEPRADYKPHVPRIVAFEIAPISCRPCAVSWIEACRSDLNWAFWLIADFS